jgi:hypothetical protein
MDVEMTTHTTTFENIACAQVFGLRRGSYLRLRGLCHSTLGSRVTKKKKSLGIMVWCWGMGAK